VLFNNIKIINVTKYSDCSLLVCKSGKSQVKDLQAANSGNQDSSCVKETVKAPPSAQLRAVDFAL